MTITGKKFSQLTESQQSSTREAWSWKLENLFLNTNQREIRIINGTQGYIIENNVIYLAQGDFAATTEIYVSEELNIGESFFVVNWFNNSSGIATENIEVTILPSQVTVLDKMFGVFKVEKTDVNEYTVTVVENGVLTGV